MPFSFPDIFALFHPIHFPRNLLEQRCSPCALPISPRIPPFSHNLRPPGFQSPPLLVRFFPQLQANFALIPHIPLPCPSLSLGHAIIPLLNSPSTSSSIKIRNLPDHDVVQTLLVYNFKPDLNTIIPPTLRLASGTHELRCGTYFFNPHFSYSYRVAF